MKLIPEWRYAWKMFSVQANAIGVAIVGAYEALPQEFKNAIPAQWVLAAAGATLVLGGIGRLVHQPTLPKASDSPAPQEPQP